MCEGLKEEFKEDYDILASKFYKQEADLAFIMGKLPEAKVAAEKGLAIIVNVSDESDAATKKATQHCHRDLLNLFVRVRSRLENKEALVIRQEECTKRGMPTTFLTMHDEMQKTLEDEVAKLEFGKQMKKNMDAEL